MKPLSLIHIVSVSGLVGTGATAFRLARLTAGRGQRVLFAVRPGSVWVEKAEGAGLEFCTEMELRAGFRPRGFFRDVAALKRLIAEREADVVHVHRSAEYWRAALSVGPAPRRAKLVRSRGVVTPLRAHLANRWLHNGRTDLVICTAQMIYDMYCALPGFDAGKVRLVHDGVDISAFNPDEDGSAAREELGIPADAPVVAVVARMREVKGHRYLVEAAPAVARKHPGVRFLLAGRPISGELEAELKERVAAQGLEENFVFAGSPGNVGGVLAAADLFALSSVGSEGSSRGTLEAMAAGLPVVASSVGCLPDLVVEERTGYLVPPRNSDLLSARIIALLDDPHLRRKMGRAGRARVEAEFDERRVAEKVEALYRETADG